MYELLNLLLFGGGLLAAQLLPGTDAPTLPRIVYALSASMFAVSCTSYVSALALVSTKARRHVSTAMSMVMAMACVVDARLAMGAGKMVADARGHALPVERYVLWGCSTNEMIYSIFCTFDAPFSDTAMVVAVDLLMIATGLLSQLESGHVMFAVSCCCFAIVLMKTWVVSGRCREGPRRRVIYGATLAVWAAMPVIDLLLRSGAVTYDTAEFAFVVVNYGAKVAYAELIGGENERQHFLDREREMQDRLDQQTSFMNVVSHELRTPIHSILHLSSSIAGGKHGRLAATGVHYLSTIIAGANRLLNMINDVLDIAAVSRGSLTVKSGAVDLRALMAEVETGIRPLVRPGVSFTCTTADDVPRFVVADDARLWQVLFNLLGNSCKFTESGIIEARARMNGADTLVLEVADSGLGISADKLCGIFQPYEQGDKSTTRKHGGTGLGLSISQAIVAAHGGI